MKFSVRDIQHSAHSLRNWYSDVELQTQGCLFVHLVLMVLALGTTAVRLREAHIQRRSAGPICLGEAPSIILLNLNKL
jgi:hypothetical protein